MFTIGNLQTVDPTVQKVIAFDLDHTLIRPKNGGTHVKNAADWEWNPHALPCLRRLNEHGFRLVIFTNQHGIDTGKRTLDDLRAQITAMIAELGYEPTVFVATKHDKWRKPSPCMWFEFRDNFLEDTVDPSEITYVGDAAGRDCDFSDSDRKFARNCGFKFQTPEAFFQGVDMNLPALRGFCLADWLALNPTGEIPGTRPYRELVIFVGPPACGKSTFARQHFAGYTVINQDTVNAGKKGTFPQCVRAAKAAMLEKSVVIDNTNSTAQTRAEYVQAARYIGVPVRCIWFDLPRDVCMHLNQVRGVMGGEIIPDIAYSVYYKKLVVPTVEEGFDKVETITWLDVTNASPVLDMRF